MTPFLLHRMLTRYAVQAGASYPVARERLSQAASVLVLEAGPWCSEGCGCESCSIELATPFPAWDQDEPAALAWLRAREAADLEAQQAWEAEEPEPLPLVADAYCGECGAWDCDCAAEPEDPRAEVRDEEEHRRATSAWLERG